MPNPKPHNASLIPHDQRPALLRQAIELIDAGQSVRSVAQSIGITHATLRAWMLNELPDEYKPAQQQCLINRVVEADDKLDDAQDMLSVARAREQCKFARWDAERRLPHLFGAKIEQTVKRTVDDDAAARLDRLSSKLTRLLHTSKQDVMDVDSQPVSDSE